MTDRIQFLAGRDFPSTFSLTLTTEPAEPPGSWAAMVSDAPPLTYTVHLVPYGEPPRGGNAHQRRVRRRWLARNETVIENATMRIEYADERIVVSGDGVRR